MSYTENGYTKLESFRETGYVVLDPYDQSADPREWEGITFVDWKSSGETRFAPLASAYGDLECDGFWNHTPPKTDKDGVWVPENAEKAPRLVARAEEPGANIGRCRVIELLPNTYAEAIYNLHRDDNNRLNPEGTGWIVRGFFNLTDDPDTVMILREVKDDPVDRDAHRAARRAPRPSSTPSGSTTRCGTRDRSRATASSRRGSPAPSSGPTSTPAAR